jgi:hypothetical protein
MYPAPWLLEDGYMGCSAREKLSPSYWAERSQRPPLVVRLPGPVDFCIDERAYKDGQHYGDGWTVTGEGSAMTLSPSINIGGIYHGWIRDGVITDDCEGRVYK